MTLALPSRPTHAGLFILAALLIGAFGLRLWDLNEPSIWHDEAWSIRAIRDPINTPDDNTPPVYYSVVHFLWAGAGESPFALRYGSVLIDLITVGLAAATGSPLGRLGRGARHGCFVWRIAAAVGLCTRGSGLYCRATADSDPAVAH